MGISAEMREDFFLLEIVRRLLHFRAIPGVETAEVALKGTTKIFQII